MCKNDSQVFRKSKKITQKQNTCVFAFGFFVNDPSAGSPTSWSLEVETERGCGKWKVEKWDQNAVK